MNKIFETFSNIARGENCCSLNILVCSEYVLFPIPILLVYYIVCSIHFSSAYLAQARSVDTIATNTVMHLGEDGSLSGSEVQNPHLGQPPGLQALTWRPYPFELQAQHRFLQVSTNHSDSVIVLCSAAATYSGIRLLNVADVSLTFRSRENSRSAARIVPRLWFVRLSVQF